MTCKITENKTSSNKTTPNEEVVKSDQFNSTIFDNLYKIMDNGFDTPYEGAQWAAPRKYTYSERGSFLDEYGFADYNHAFDCHLAQDSGIKVNELSGKLSDGSTDNTLI